MQHIDPTFEFFYLCASWMLMMVFSAWMSRQGTNLSRRMVIKRHFLMRIIWNLKLTKMKALMTKKWKQQRIRCQIDGRNLTVFNVEPNSCTYLSHFTFVLDISKSCVREDLLVEIVMQFIHSRSIWNELFCGPSCTEVKLLFQKICQFSTWPYVLQGLPLICSSEHLTCLFLCSRIPHAAQWYIPVWNTNLLAWNTDARSPIPSSWIRECMLSTSSRSKTSLRNVHVA